MKTIRFSHSILFLLLSSLVGFLSAQNDKTDSIIKIINQLQKENKIAEINGIINQNTSLDPELTLSVLNQNIENSQNPGDLADSYYATGSFWARQGDKTKAYQNFVNSENFSREAHDEKKLGKSILGQANIISEFPEKIEKYQQAIQIIEEQKDTLNLIRTHLNLGYVYHLQLSEENLSEEEKVTIRKYTEITKLPFVFLRNHRKFLPNCKWYNGKFTACYSGPKSSSN